MVQRYALGLYRKMGLEHLAANSPEAYEAMAVRLATDRDYREAVRAHILERSGVLFDDLETVGEHEEFFEDALSRARAAQG